MKAKFGREIALLCLPVLLFGGAALWKGKLKRWSGWGAPLGLYEGKPRLEITRWQKVEPTTVDLARGISSRWIVTAWNGGVCPVGRTQPKNLGIKFPHNLFFAYKLAGKWHKLPIEYPESEVDVQNFWIRQKPSSHEVHLGLPMELVPRDAEEVRLQGRMDGWMLCSSGSINAPSAPIDVLLKEPQKAWPKFAGSRVTVLKFREAKQKWLHLNPVRFSGSDNLQVEATFSYFGASTGHVLRKARSWIVDSKGITQAEAHVSDNAFVDNRNGIATGIWQFDARNFTSKAGPFTLKSWVFVDENEWPLQVSIPLKPVPTARNSRLSSPQGAKTTKAIR